MAADVHIYCGSSLAGVLVWLGLLVRLEKRLVPEAPPFLRHALHHTTPSVSGLVLWPGAPNNYSDLFNFRFVVFSARAWDRPCCCYSPAWLLAWCIRSCV